MSMERVLKGPDPEKVASFNLDDTGNDQRPVWPQLEFFASLSFLFNFRWTNLTANVQTCSVIVVHHTSYLILIWVILFHMYRLHVNIHTYMYVCIYIFQAVYIHLFFVFFFTSA